MSTAWTESKMVSSGLSPSRWTAFCVWLLTALFVSAWSLTISPVPGINEPHYLTKARHFVDPEWCDRDFFLDSTDVHTVFFALAGPLTKWTSFAAAAIIGRILSALTIAWGWRRLALAFGVRDRWIPFSVVMMLIIARGVVIPAGVIRAGLEIPLGGHFSGEWIVGAFESKVPAFGFVFAAIAAAMRREWIRAGLFTGVATSLHPVVGGWLLLSLIFAGIFGWLRILFAAQAPAVSDDDMARPRRGGMLQFVVPFALAAAPGLIPAVSLLMDPTVGQQERNVANFIQVFGRLKHHLDPYDFPLQAWLMLAGLAICIALLVFVRRRPSPDELPDESLRNAKRMLTRVFLAGALFTAAGIAIGARTVPAIEVSMWQERALLLKFYPFRLLDALLPVVAALLLTERVARWTSRMPLQAVPAVVATGAACVLAAIVSHINPHPPAERLTAERAADWADACQWVRSNTPTDALFYTPRSSTTFKWRAERAEFLNYKDCPQDAAGINEWNRRLWKIDQWSKESSADGQFDREDFQNLHDRFGIDYVITRRMEAVKPAPLFENRTWRVYACEP